MSVFSIVLIFWILKKYYFLICSLFPVSSCVSCSSMETIRWVLWILCKILICYSLRVFLFLFIYFSFKIIIIIIIINCVFMPFSVSYDAVGKTVCIRGTMRGDNHGWERFNVATYSEFLGFNYIVILYYETWLILYLKTIWLPMKCIYCVKENVSFIIYHQRQERILQYPLVLRFSLLPNHSYPIWDNVKINQKGYCCTLDTNCHFGLYSFRGVILHLHLAKTSY